MSPLRLTSGCGPSTVRGTGPAPAEGDGEVDNQPKSGCWAGADHRSRAGFGRFALHSSFLQRRGLQSGDPPALPGPGRVQSGRRIGGGSAAAFPAKLGFFLPRYAWSRRLHPAGTRLVGDDLRFPSGRILRLLRAHPPRCLFVKVPVQVGIYCCPFGPRVVQSLSPGGGAAGAPQHPGVLPGLGDTPGHEGWTLSPGTAQHKGPRGITHRPGP